MRNGLLTTFVIAIFLITYQEVAQRQEFPKPQRYLYAAMVWAVLGVVSEFGAPEIATLFGVGLLLSLLYTFFTGKGNVGVLPPLPQENATGPLGEPAGVDTNRFQPEGQ